jgi:hypothetical protein
MFLDDYSRSQRVIFVVSNFSTDAKNFGTGIPMIGLTINWGFRFKFAKNKDI